MYTNKYAGRGAIRSSSVILAMLVVISLLLTAAPSTFAAINQWTSGGPAGGKITAAVINNNTPALMYVGTEGGGIFKSTNAGASWSADNSGVANLFIQALATDISDPTVVYAGTRSGLFKKDKNAAIWTNQTAGKMFFNTSTPVPGYITSVVVEPPPASLPTLRFIYAGTDGSGVIKSSDGGKTWTDVTKDLGNRNVNALAIDLKNSSFPNTIIYAGTAGGVYKSTNGGGTWTAVNTGLGANLTVTALAVDTRTTPVTIYAGTAGGIFMSTDDGANWSAVPTGLSITSVQSLAVDPVSLNTLYAGTAVGGVFKIVNSGGTWSAANGLANESIHALAINPTTSTTLYAGSADGLFRSDTGGGAWSPANVGLNGIVIRSLAVDPVTPTIIYVGSLSNGVFRSIDAGATWAALHNGLTNSNVAHLVLDPVTPTVIYAGTSGGGVFRSSDSGVNWVAVNSGLSSNLSITALVIDPQNPTTLYAGTNTGGVFKSDNSGGTWTPFNTGLDPAHLTIYALAVDPRNPATLYLGNNNTGVIYRYDNRAGTWGALPGTPLMEPNTAMALAINSLVVNPSSSADIFAIAGGGFLYQSTDSGGSWRSQIVGAKLNAVNALAVDPWTPTTMYALVNNTGVLKSTDSGSTWGGNIYLGGAISSTLSAMILALSPSAPSLIYVGATNGVVHSYDQFAIFGTVKDVNVLPVGGATVTVQGSSPACSATTLADGRYTLSCIPYDTNFSLNISKAGYASTSSPVMRLTASASGLDYSLKGVAAVTLTGLSQTYDGTVKSVMVSTVPAGLAVTITYSGTPVAAGSYAVVASVADPRYTGSFSGTLVIAPAAANVTLGATAAAYNGVAKSMTVTTVPAGLAVAVTYNGSATLPTAAGTYAVVATVTDPNYTGRASGTLTITPPPALSDLVVTTVTVSKSGTRGKTIKVSATVKNQGTASATASTLSLYLSVDTVIVTTDTRLGAVAIPSLAAGASKAVTTTVTIPSTLAAGSYTIGAIADSALVVVESNEANNALAGGKITVK